MVTAALRSVFAQESAAVILSRWDDLAASLAERCWPICICIMRLMPGCGGVFCTSRLSAMRTM